MKIHITTDDGEELDFTGKMIILSTESGCTLIGHGSYGDIMDILANSVIASHKVGTDLMKSYIKEDNKEYKIPTLQEFIKELGVTTVCADAISKVNGLMGDGNDIILNFIQDNQNCQINLKEYLIQMINKKFDELLGEDEN